MIEFGTGSEGRPLVTLDVGSAAARLTMTRPEARNALSVALCNAVGEALAAAEGERKTRVLVLQGEGSVFCAGADFSAVSGPGGLEFLPAFEAMLEGVARCRLPVIARIQGAALGGGLQLAVACDFRVASTAAKVGIPSARLGIVVNFENVQRLVVLVGPAVAKEVLMTGRTYEGDAARAAGLVGRVVPEEQLDDAVDDLAGRIVELAPLSVQGSKRSIQAVVDHLSGARSSNPAEVAQIDELVARAYASADLAEGLRALAEKRKPGFTGT